MIRRLVRLALKLAFLQAAVLGLTFLARQFVQEWGDSESNEFQLAALVDGRELRSRATALRGGTAIAIYGGIELDLREAELAAEVATIKCLAIFGGVALLVPDGWRVTVDGRFFFGGSELRTTPEEDLPEDAPRLHVQATTVFGGIAVRSKAIPQATAA